MGHVGAQPARPPTPAGRRLEGLNHPVRAACPLAQVVAGVVFALMSQVVYLCALVSRAAARWGGDPLRPPATCPCPPPCLPLPCSPLLLALTCWLHGRRRVQLLASLLQRLTS